MKTRKIVSICNIVISILCLVSIVAYFFMPFWKVELSYTMNAETLQAMMPKGDDSEEGNEEENEEGKEEGKTDSSDENLDAKDVYGNLDFKEIIGEEGITIKLGITLQTQDILSSFSTSPKRLVKAILEENARDIVDQLDEPLNDIVKKAVKIVVKTALTEGIKEEVKASLGENATDEELKQELNSAGLTDEYIDDKTNQLVDSIYKENADAESAAEDTLSIIEESIEKMKESGNPDYADLELSEEDRKEWKETLVEQFKNFETEDGKLDPEAFTSEFLLNLLTGEGGFLGGTEEGEGGESGENGVIGEGEESEGGKVEKSMAKPLSVRLMNGSASDSDSASDSTSDSSDSALDQEQTDAKEELQEVLTEKLMEALEDSVDTVATILQAVGYVIIATFVIWLYPILKILAKIKRHNNAIKLGLPIWLGSLPYVLLCLLPMGMISAVMNPSLPIAGMIPEIEIMKAFSVTCSSCAIVSFVIGIALALFVIFFYARLRRTLKKEAQQARKNMQDTRLAVPATESVAVVVDAPEAAAENTTEEPGNE